MRNGMRLTGTMTGDDIARFCDEHHIRCIIDAAHPFAAILHKGVEQCGLPVIRLERRYPTRRTGIIYCDDYADAIRRMESEGIERLLALTGVNTIKELAPYWHSHFALFRILDRDESRAIVKANGFPQENIIYYNSCHTIPGKEAEKALMQSVRCEAIITKESGESGGYEAKVNAAIDLGLKVFVVKKPSLPSHWFYATGQYELRRAIEILIPDFFPQKME